MRISQQVGDIQLGTGKVIVQAKDVTTIIEQAFAQMRTEETGTAGDKNTFFQGAWLWP
jgi:hypothetical protein